MAVIYASLTNAYAKAIYLDGTKRFPEIRTEYVEPVKQYAGTGIINGLPYPKADSTGYTDQQILTAFERQFITEQEFDETMAYKYPSEQPPEPTA